MLIKSLCSLVRFVLHDLYKRKAFSLAFIFIVLFLYSAHLVGKSMIGSYEKVLCDAFFFCLQSYSYVYIFMYVIPFYERYQQSTLFSYIVSRGVKRSSLCVGIFLGFSLGLVIIHLLYYGATKALFYYLLEKKNFYLEPGCLGSTFEALFWLTAGYCLAFIFQPMLNSLTLISLYLLCFTVEGWQQLAIKEESGLSVLLCSLIPRLSIFDLKNLSYYALSLDSYQIIATACYLLSVQFLLITAAMQLFSKKEL